MKFYSRLATSTYSAVNRSGLMKMSLMKKVFRVAYFSYKKYLEDPFPKLVKKRPELFKNGSILDIGANVGFTASTFCVGLSQNQSVYAFEPEATNFLELELTSKRFEKIGKIEPILAAVGETEGEVELWVNRDHHADHRILTEDFSKNRSTLDTPHTTVPLVQIDNWVKNGQIRKPIVFIKIDIQGYELPALRGMRETLSEFHPVLTVEYCPKQIKLLGFNPKDLIQFITDLNYEIKILNQDGTTREMQVKEINSLTGDHDYLNFLCEKKQ